MADFRREYLNHAALTAQLKDWAECYPEFVRLESLVRTEEGRDLWLLTVGPEPDRPRPAVWVDGNMHASELCGSNVALGIANAFIDLHAGNSELGASLLDRLREVLVYVVPRISPDGAEAVLDSGRYVRSVPRDRRVRENHCRWLAEDVDGDGRALLMRQKDEGGEFVESSTHPGLMLPRQIEDSGPFYKVFPEGHIEGFDGDHIPSPGFLADNSPDLNRNFPFSWKSEDQQVGAGPLPLSEPESRAIAEFAIKKPHIFAWLNLHTFGGVFIRPPGDTSDSDMPPGDLAVFRQIEAWGEALTGYPMVSGFKEFTYEPKKPLSGDLSEWAHSHRGCVAYVCELWDLFHRLGIERPERFVDFYSHFDRRDFERFHEWDAAENQGRVFRPWRHHTHSQLGDVEVGGMDPMVGLYNPPPELLSEICDAQAALWLKVAAMAPQIRLGAPHVERLGPQLHHVRLDVTNIGYLGTQVLESAKPLDHSEPLEAIATTDGCEIVGRRRQEIGHLDGWGRGRFDSGSALYYQRSRGSTHRKVLHFTVQGKGRLQITVRAARVGSHEVEVVL